MALIALYGTDPDRLDRVLAQVARVESLPAPHGGPSRATSALRLAAGGDVAAGLGDLPNRSADECVDGIVDREVQCRLDILGDGWPCERFERPECGRFEGEFGRPESTCLDPSAEDG